MSAAVIVRRLRVERLRFGCGTGDGRSEIRNARGGSGGRSRCGSGRIRQDKLVDGVRGAIWAFGDAASFEIPHDVE